VNKNEKKLFIKKHLELIENICDIHERIKGIDISLMELYPISIVSENIFFVFDLDHTKKKYEYKMEYKSTMDIPDNVLAAFPLDFYCDKISAVVTPNAFECIEDMVYMFHEFVHCYQFSYYETNLKNTLNVAQEAMEKQDYMWEIKYPFPYEDEIFMYWTKKLNEGYDIVKYHKELYSKLKQNDFEYMVWQEWKEGYARYIENLVREKLNLKKNTNILVPPFDRTCFYEIGSRYIEKLVNDNTNKTVDLEKMFTKMKNCE
jgi:hypothetical protein